MTFTREQEGVRKAPRKETHTHAQTKREREKVSLCEIICFSVPILMCTVLCLLIRRQSLDSCMSEGLKHVLVLEKESKSSSGAAGAEDTPQDHGGVVKQSLHMLVCLSSAVTLTKSEKHFQG